MSSKRTILIEAALVIAVMTTGMAAAQAAFAAPLAVAMQNAANPQANVKIESNIQVERTEENAAGVSETKLFKPADVKVIPGDKLIFTNSYRNSGATPVTGFVVNNPVHPAVSFTDVSEAWAVVSVDGGKTFGKLVDLTVTEQASPSGEANPDSSEAAPPMVTRPAQPADVTHIRWKFARPIAAGATGKLQFSGVVK